jgi:chromate transporter
MTVEETKEEEAMPPQDMTEAELEATNGDAPPTEEDLKDQGDPTMEEVEIETGESEDQDGKEGKDITRIAADAPWWDRMKEVFMTFWPLGLVAFGGPQAHVAILRDHLVVQRGWMDEESFMELFAIGQGLPGPTSTQLVISTALSRAGPLGGLMAFLLWNLPGLIILTLCGSLIDAYLDPNDPPWYLVGLPAAAVSLVFKAFYGFAIKLDYLGVCLALMSCLVALVINGDEDINPSSSQFMFPSVLAIGGIVTILDSKREKPFGSYGSPSKGWDAESDATMKRIGIPLWMGGFLFFLWLFVLVLVICLKDVANITNVYLDIFETMYRIGSIIFGGGQVVLPMLQDEVVPAWMTDDQFLQGLGLAQSMPGPLCK